MIMRAAQSLIERSRLKVVGAMWRAGQRQEVCAPRIPSGALSAPLVVDLEFVGAYLSATRPRVTFVQIGAFDGHTNDPLHDVIRSYGWRGVLVEPQPLYFAMLRQTYADVVGLTFVNAAVAAQRGTATLWYVSDGGDDLPEWVPQIASFDRDHVVTHLRSRPDLMKHIVGHEVATVTLADIFARAPGPVDVLQIDAEGFDAKIVNMLNFREHRPTVIRFEHRNISIAEHNKTVDHLVRQGYRISLGSDDTLAMLYTPGRGSSATT